MKIALLGFGVEGKSAYAYLAKQYPEAEFAVYADTPATGLPENVGFTQTTDFHDIDADLVVRSPSIPPRMISARGEITSVTKLFFDRCPAPIVGVTGSKGKGTTSSFIASILRAGGKKAHLLGNIGEPALDVLPHITADDVVVYEMSSFQLWDMTQSPTVAVVLMIEPDHLEVHSGMEEYVAAKGNIARYQTSSDMVIFTAGNTYAEQIAAASAGKKVPNPSQDFVHIQDDAFWFGQTRLCSTSVVKLPGAHNLTNAAAAINAAWRWVQDGESIAQGLGAFTGLPHRLKFVRELHGVKYYDDSIATTPGSAIAALKAFDQPKVLILGGSTKGADFNELAEYIGRSTMRSIILIGQEAPRIAKALDSREIDYELLEGVTMADVVATAQAAAQAGDVVILSPSCASFGMFKNYKDRGDQFIAAVQSLQ